MITSLMAGCAFGYCLVDLFFKYRSNKQMQQFMKDFEVK